VLVTRLVLSPLLAFCVLFPNVAWAADDRRSSETPSASRAGSDEPIEDAAPASANSSPQSASAGDEGSLDPAEPDFYVVNLPTTLRLPRHKGTFRLTHRFGGNLRDGSFGDQASNLFGLDEGATVGLEFRYAVTTGLQAVITRSSFQKTIQFSGKYDALHQTQALPVSISAIVSVEGADNFQERFAPAVGAIVSHEIGDRATGYASPIWVHHTAAELGVDQDTMLLGLGGRLRFTDSLYIVGEMSPRLGGYKPGKLEYGFGIEKRVGGHVFQLTFANTNGTTYGQIARGGTPETLYLGFNLTRKFF
jgi:hypothetical protein